METDFHGMKRKDLQTLCKNHGIPANLKNIEMANRLASLFKKETVMETDISQTLSLEMEMDFHGMKRKDLQSLCKKHGIPASLKNIEMANRLASLFKKETVMETDISPEDLVEADENNAKKVSFSPEVEVFEFTKSVKKCQRKSVRSRSQGKRVVDKGIMTVAGSNENESDTRKGIVPRRSNRNCSGNSTQEGCKVSEVMAPDGLSGEIQFEKVERRSKRLAGNISESFVDGMRSKAGTLLPSKRSKRLVDSDDNVTEVSVDLEVQETRKHHRNDVHDDYKVEKVPRRSRRLVNDSKIDTQDLRSVRVRDVAANPSVCSVKESKEERKTKQSKRSAVVSSQEDELVESKTKEPLIDCEVVKCPRIKVQDVSKVETVTRRSRRLGNKVHVDENGKDVKHDDQGLEKAPRQSRKLEKCVSELLVDCQVQTADNTAGQEMSSSPKRCLVIESEGDEASVDNSKKFNVNDEMQVSGKAAKVVEGNLVGTKTDETLVKSSKRVTRSMKRDRSVQPGMELETASTQDNLTPKELFEEYARFAGDTNVEARGSSKKSKTMTQESMKESPSSSKTKAAESVMIIENVLDSTLEKSVGSQKTNTQEFNSELMEAQCEEKLECVTVSTTVIEEEKEEVSSHSVLLIKSLSPASVQLAGSSPEAALLVPTGHNRLKDVEEENTKTKGETLTSSPRSELKEHNSTANLAKVEVTLENSDECCKEIHLSNEDKKGSLEKEVQAENLPGKFSECNTENSIAEEEMEISKVGNCVKLEPEEAGRANVEARGSSKQTKTVNQEESKDKQQGMVEDSPFTSETKATEPVMVSENVFDSTVDSSVDNSSRRNTKELHVELMEGEGEEKREQDTALKTVDQESLKDKPQGMTEDSPSKSETKVTEAVTISENVYVSTMETPVDTSSNTKELQVELMEGDREEKREQDTALKTVNQENLEDKPQGMVKDLPFTSETKATEAIMISENVFVSRLETSVDTSSRRKTKELRVELMEGAFEEKREQDTASKTVNQECLEDKPQGVDEDSPFTSETKATEAVMISENVFLSTLETSVDTSSRRNTKGLQVELIEGDREEKREQDTATLDTVNQERFKDKPQGMFEDSPFTSETKATESIMMSENVFDSTLKTSVDISLRRNTQEWNVELMEGECEEKREQDIALMAEIKEREEASSPSVFLMEGSEENKSEAEFEVSTDHILVKNLDLTVVAEENIKTKEEIPNSIPRSELKLKEQSFVATLAETGTIVQDPAEWWIEIQSSKDDERGSLEKDLEAPNLHENFSECNSDNISAEEQVETSKVGCISSGHCATMQSVDKVNDDNMEKSEQTISSERGFKPNVELRGLSSTDFASPSPKEENISDGFERDALLVNKAASSALDESTVFTTPEKKLFLMEQLSENGKTYAVNSVTYHNDEAVESHVDVSTTPKQVLQMRDGVVDESRKEEEHTASDIPDESDVINTTKRCLMLGSSRNHKARNEEGGIVVELHDEPVIETSPLRQSSVEDFKGTYTSSQRHELLRTPVSNGAENSTGNKVTEFLVFTGLEERHELSGELCGECSIFTAAEKHLLLEDNVGVKSHDIHIATESQSLMRDSEQHDAEDKYREIKDVFISPERRQLLGNSEPHNTGKQEYGINTVADSSSNSHEFNAGQETSCAEFMPKVSQTQETSKHSREHSLQVDSDLLDFDIEEAETMMETDSNVYILALPAKGTSETIDDISSHLEVAGTCSMVSEEGIISPSTNINQINNALQELDLTGDELIEANSIHKGNLKLDSPNGSNVTPKTSTYLKDESTSPIATVFDEEMVKREATRSPEQASNEEDLNESSKLSEKQVRREPILIYGTQIKSKLHDMKENVLNSKIVDNLNVTALRTSKRQPLQDLGKMN